MKAINDVEHNRHAREKKELGMKCFSFFLKWKDINGRRTLISVRNLR